MAVQAVSVAGLKELRRDLKALGPQWGRELSKVHREIAKDVQGKAQSTARGMGRQQSREAGAIKASGTQSAAALSVVQSSRYPFANVAFWGKIKRTGWYAGGHGRAQSLPWVGNTWQVGVKGEGPYALNEAVADRLPQIMHNYEQMLDALMHRAFPE
jgi:hypothetical protein